MNGAILDMMKNADKPCVVTLITFEQLQVPVSRMATLHLKAKLEWFSKKKSEGITNHSFCNNQMCMLVLACYIVAEVPDNLKSLSFYKLKRICHSSIF